MHPWVSRSAERRSGVGVRVQGEWSNNSTPLEGAPDLILFRQRRLINALAFALEKATAAFRRPWPWNQLSRSQRPRHDRGTTPVDLSLWKTGILDLRDSMNKLTGGELCTVNIGGSNQMKAGGSYMTIRDHSRRFAV